MRVSLPACLAAAFLHRTAAESNAPAFLPAVQAVAFNSAADIAKHFDLRMAEALERYLADHPDAGDAVKVMGYLASTYQDLGDIDRQLATLENQYAAIAKGESGDSRTAYGNIMRRLFIHRGNNSAAVLDKAFAALEQGKRDFPGFADPDSVEGSTFNDLIAKLKQHSIGSPVEIAFTAVDGTKVDIGSMKGKVVLVLYWEPPLDGRGDDMLKSVKAAHEKLRGKGFEVIGLSNERNRSAIESFVQREDIRWPQSFGGQGWDYSPAVQLSVNTLPFNFLVGKDGKMAARHVRGDDLEAMVAGLLN